MEYLVTWKIYISANSPEEAAKKALKIQRDPNSTATYFTVMNDRTKEITWTDIKYLPNGKLYL